MALKITTQIGTDKGITDEAYVRISSYNLQTAGSATFYIQIYENESVAKGETPELAGLARNSQIGDMIVVALNSTIENKDGTKTIVKDLSPAVGVDIFTFGYASLKDKLVGLFGEKNVIDC
jgi:hypothetical protein